MLYLALHNFMVIHKSVSHIKATDCNTFRLQLIRGVTDEQGWSVPHPGYTHSFSDSLPKIHRTSFYGERSYYWEKGKISEKMSHVS
jgi:hypothetical protein